MAEVWSIPMFLRVALIRCLTQVMNTLKECHETCIFVDNLLADMETNEITTEKLSQALEDAGKEFPLSCPMIVHLVTHLRERADYTENSLKKVFPWFAC
jgi:cyclic beta-1,2-glucan synthetase